MSFSNNNGICGTQLLVQNILKPEQLECHLNFDVHCFVSVNLSKKKIIKRFPLDGRHTWRYRWLRLGTGVLKHMQVSVRSKKSTRWLKEKEVQ